MRRFIVTISLLFFAATVFAAETSKPASDINAKIAQLDINKATIEDVIRIFGEPEKYLWGNQTFTKDNLPSTYIAEYPNRLQIVIGKGRVIELRFNGQDAGYVFRDKIRIGSSLDEVLDVLGQPKLTIEGQANEGKDGVLYKDIDGRKGFCYYARLDQGVRFFFDDYKVAALYLTSKKTVLGGGGSLQDIKTIDSVNEYNDVRWKDMSNLDLSDKNRLIPTLTFNLKTVWPPLSKMPKGNEPNKILNDAMNPGLGVRELHQQGITGKGVNVAIIDQPMYLNHPEFAGKIVAYYDTGCEVKSSMHGPAVASLLVGTNCGTAPDARVYYAAAPSWKKDSAYYAKALNWIIERNAELPVSEKIRVVSVSAAPSGQESPFDKNNEMWDKACTRAEADGIMVLDCTDNHRGFIYKCWYDFRFPESVARCKPGDPRYNYNAPKRPLVLAPTAPRTTAEQTDKDNFSYQYCGTAGQSWAIPYCAGVLAMGWQVRPELPPQKMRELLFESAYTKSNGAKIIYPENFIKMVKAAKVVPNKSK